jgi:hypothetical protein
MHWFMTASPETRASWPHDPNGPAWFAEDGRYHLFAREPGRFVAIGSPIATPLRDVEIEASFVKVGGPPGGGYGIIVRDEGPGRRDGQSQDGRFYVFAAGDRGEFGIWRREGGQWIDLVPWTPSEAVSPGETKNDLSVRALGQQFRFAINGREVATVADSTLGQGSVGIFAGGDYNLVVVDLFFVMTQPT